MMFSDLISVIALQQAWPIPYERFSLPGLEDWERKILMKATPRLCVARGLRSFRTFRKGNIAMFARCTIAFRSTEWLQRNGNSDFHSYAQNGLE